jgi:hypothetical protein
VKFLQEDLTGFCGVLLSFISEISGFWIHLKCAIGTIDSCFLLIWKFLNMVKLSFQCV